jgi:hypothetical protein
VIRRTVKRYLKAPRYLDLNTQPVIAVSVSFHSLV